MNVENCAGWLCLKGLDSSGFSKDEELVLSFDTSIEVFRFSYFLQGLLNLIFLCLLVSLIWRNELKKTLNISHDSF